MAQEVITTKELMARLKLSEPSIIRYRKKGKIPFIQIGNSIRYDWEKVVHALEKGTKYA